jgi:predicted nucleic acid-binding protein
MLEPYDGKLSRTVLRRLGLATAPGYPILMTLDKSHHCCTIVQKITSEMDMDIVIDASALIAVLVDEPERKKIIQITAGNTLIGPGSIPWEIGNAFSAMFKQNRLTLDEAQTGITIFKNIPIRYLDPDFANALQLSKTINMYAYDAYILDCAIRYKSPLLSLDRKLLSAAQSIKVETLEV